MYELGFVRRTVAAGDTARLADLRFTARYLDDLFSANSRLFAGLRYDIYPQQFLVLDPSEPAPARTVHFLDLEVFQDPHFGLSHRLFDKRREECYHSIPLVRFPHRLSVMPARFRFNIVQSQIHRFRILCLRSDDFVLEVARLIAILHQNKGYSLYRLMKLTRRSLDRTPAIYGARSSYGVFIRVRAQLRVFLARGEFRSSCV